MDAIERARSTAQSQIDEILTNAQIRQCFTNFFVANALEIYAYDNMRTEVKTELIKILKYKASDPAATYRGLLLQLNGTFELFVRHLVSAVLQDHSSKVKKYSELSDTVKNAHAVCSGAILAKMHDGTINGVKYNFDSLQRNLGECFQDVRGFHLNTDAFTLLIGNCTPARLEKLFQTVGLSPPFDDATGKNKAVRKWANGARAREAASGAAKELGLQLGKRNEIAHGSNALTVLPADVENAAVFYSALADAFVEKARAAIT